MTSFACVVCKKSRGKVKCECLCENATVHKQCMVSLALSLYRRKTDKCQTCQSKIHCLKQHHFFAATRLRLEERLQYSKISFGKIGMVPRYHGCWNLSESDMNYLQQTWANAVEEELKDSPNYVEQTLHNVKKRKLEFMNNSQFGWH